MKYKRPARESAYLYILRHATKMKRQGGLCYILFYGILIKCLRVLDKIRRWQWALDKSSKG
jgi:hypothetical protein